MKTIPSIREILSGAKGLANIQDVFNKNIRGRSEISAEDAVTDVRSLSSGSQNTRPSILPSANFWNPESGICCVMLDSIKDVTYRAKHEINKVVLVRLPPVCLPRVLSKT